MECIFLPDGACDLAADGRGRAGVCVDLGDSPVLARYQLSTLHTLAVAMSKDCHPAPPTRVSVRESSRPTLTILQVMSLAST